MNWHNVKLIFLREVRDQLRDRRTLFVILVLPLMLYPALGIGMLQMTMFVHEQPRTVVILGEKHLPSPQLLDGDRFSANWFMNPADAEKLRVITDTSVEAGKTGMTPEQAKLIDQAQLLRTRVEQHADLELELRQAERHLDESLRGAANAQSGSPSENHIRILELKAKLHQFDHELNGLFTSSQIQVLIVVPEGFKENIERVNQMIAKRDSGNQADLSYARPTIVKNRADDKSVAAYSRVREVLEGWEHEILRQRLSNAGLPQELPNPIGSAPLDLAADEQVSANLWSKTIALLVIMTVTGAFYPAVDVAAGEKERGTMETLLICPATRTEIVLGKFLTVICFSMSTALLNLLTIGITGNYLRSMITAASRSGANQMGSLSLPGVSTLAWLLLLLIPLSALFSSLSLALATFARSSKEGQYYLTPLLMFSIGLTVFCLFPVIEIYPVNESSWFYSVVPVVNIVLMMKALLLNPGSTDALVFIIPVLLTSIGYSLLGLWWAIEQFANEAVLFRDGERFELALWLKHLLREKEPTPNFTEAGFCFVLIMLAQFVSLEAFGQSVASVAADQLGVHMMKLMVIQQLAIIACPALFMALLLTSSVRRSLRLWLPNWRFVAIAVALPFALHPLSLELMASLHWFFPKLPDGAARMMQAMGDGEQPLALILIAFATAPAICEELAFRGFVLTGFSRNGRTGLAIGLSALTFGVMHMIPQQVFNATLLGVVLGLIAIRSNSLLPGVVFHFVFNSIAVMRERVGKQLIGGRAEELQQSVWHWFVTLEEGGVRYTWLTLVVAGIAASLSLRWVWQSGQSKTPAEPIKNLLAEGLAPANHQHSSAVS